MFSSSSSEDDSMMNDEPLSLSSPPGGLMPTIDAWANSTQAGSHDQEDNTLQAIELSLYPNSDIPGEILSISEAEPRDNETSAGGRGSQQSSFSMTNNENKQSGGGQPIPFESLDDFDEKPPLELPTSTRLKVKIKRLKIVGEWRWVDGKGDNCGICRTSFETCCVDCKFPGDDCPLALGACTHAFHMHCIVKWTNAQNGQKSVCPLCRQEWKYATKTL